MLSIAGILALGPASEFTAVSSRQLAALTNLLLTQVKHREPKGMHSVYANSIQRLTSLTELLLALSLMKSSLP
jgi:hypothetical protein